MTEAVQFIRRGGKVLGPITPSKMDSLKSEGKLRGNDDVGPSKTGPWTSYQTLLDEKAERAASKAFSEPIEAAVAVEGNPEASDWSEMPSPAFSAPVFTSPSNAAANGPRQAPQTSSQRQFAGGPSLDLLQYLMPWRGETEDQPFWALQRWVELSRVIAMVLYWIVLILPLIMMLLSVTQFVFSEMTSIGEKFLAVGFIPVAIVIWLAICHLYYILTMAGVDFLRAVMAIERNTR